ncbi:hypothetical protein [Nocardia arthritidis]|uniref:ESX-1 secretion-associated protein n=1 Tax=Nocardia arthritidis TaxID=228602 RepID=A0A6G9YBQ5_9NOCA|nr:hypothetical protein [Nocardia arthritidis]QIS10598.1 hypothetical protein F5544_13545 [Nocardia arthritidis]
MSLRTDLDIIAKLASTLHDLAGQAAGVKADNAPDPNADSPILSGRTAGEITRDLITNSLIPTAKERLNETGDVMSQAATQFQNMDDSAADQFIAMYNGATGDWVGGTK